MYRSCSRTIKKTMYLKNRSLVWKIIELGLASTKIEIRVGLTRKFEALALIQTDLIQATCTGLFAF